MSNDDWRRAVDELEGELLSCAGQVLECIERQEAQIEMEQGNWLPGRARRAKKCRTNPVPLFCGSGVFRGGEAKREAADFLR